MSSIWKRQAAGRRMRSTSTRSNICIKSERQLRSRTSFRDKKLLAPSRTSNFKILFIRTKRSEESRLSRLAHARPPHSRRSLRRLPSAPLHAGVGFFPEARTSCALSASRGSSGSKPDVSTMHRCLLNKKQLSGYDSCPPPAGFEPATHGLTVHCSTS